MKKIFTKLGLIAASAMASASSFAATTGNGPTGTVGVSSNAFDGFRDTVVTWAKGPLGTGLAITMMLMGAGLGVAKNSPMPALSGIAGAAFLNWGPGIIMSLTEGALI